MAETEMKVAPEYDGPSPLQTGTTAGVTVLTQPLPQPLIAQPPIRSYQMDDLAPHNFMMLAIIVAFICGFFHIPTLICSIPAVVLSAISHNHSKKGDFKWSKIYGNASVVLSVVAIIFGFVANFIGLAFCVWLVAALQECGLSGNCY